VSEISARTLSGYVVNGRGWILVERLVSAQQRRLTRQSGPALGCEHHWLTPPAQRRFRHRRLLPQGARLAQSRAGTRRIAPPLWGKRRRPSCASVGRVRDRNPSPKPVTERARTSHHALKNRASDRRRTAHGLICLATVSHAIEYVEHPLHRFTGTYNVSVVVASGERGAGFPNLLGQPIDLVYLPGG